MNVVPLLSQKLSEKTPFRKTAILARTALGLLARVAKGGELSGDVHKLAIGDRLMGYSQGRQGRHTFVERT